jgi:hypothetical protein
MCLLISKVCHGRHLRDCSGTFGQFLLRIAVIEDPFSDSNAIEFLGQKTDIRLLSSMNRTFSHPDQEHLDCCGLACCEENRNPDLESRRLAKIAWLSAQSALHILIRRK